MNPSPRPGECALALSIFLAPWLLAEGPRPARTVMVPMRDGIRLATDVYLPQEDARGRPAILVRTPYGRRQYNKEYGSWTRWGYAVAIQDTRGRFDSEGKAVAFVSDGWGELQDGYDTVQWLAGEEFTNGRVGTVGASAMGITQLLMAPAAPPALACQYILVAAASHYHHAAYPGGAFRKSLVEKWLEDHQFDPESLARAWNHPLYDEEWVALDTMAAAGRVRVPAVHVGGWYDVFSQGTIDAFVSLQTRGGPGCRGRQKLIMGPWVHGGAGKREFGDFELPPPARAMPHGLSARRWFDHHLGGEANGVEELPPVTYYVMGPLDGTPSSGNVWRQSDVWPVAAVEVPFFLHRDGALQENAAPHEEAVLSFRYDPAEPVPTLGGRNLNLKAGPVDQRPVEARPDVLVFTTAPLSADLEVTGRMRVELAFSSDRRDTDAVVFLCDVYPDRRSVLVAEGARRLALRGGFAKLEYLEPGRPAAVEVDLWSTSIVFARGHRIRVSVTSSSYPRWAANPNTGVYPRGGGEALPARNAIHLGGPVASRLVLPVLRRGDGEAGIGRLRDGTTTPRPAAPGRRQ